GQQRIYVFATADNGHLVVNYWDGGQWQWADQGLPAGVAWLGSLSAITYRDCQQCLGGGQQRIYVFCTSDASDHLVVNYWDGAQWHWADQGVPSDASYLGELSAMTFSSCQQLCVGGGQQRIYVFTTAFDQAQDTYRLVVNYWDGSQWHWADQ